MLYGIYFPLILFNTSCGIYSIPKESKYTAAFPSIDNETQCDPLPPYLGDLRHKIYFFILGKLFLQKAPLNLGL